MSCFSLFCCFIVHCSCITRIRNWLGALCQHCETHFYQRYLEMWYYDAVFLFVLYSALVAGVWSFAVTGFRSLFCGPLYIAATAQLLFLFLFFFLLRSCLRMGQNVWITWYFSIVPWAGLSIVIILHTFITVQRALSRIWGENNIKQNRELINIWTVFIIDLRSFSHEEKGDSPASLILHLVYLLVHPNIYKPIARWKSNEEKQLSL